MRSTLEILEERFGAVMTLEQLAITLSRKPEGLRMALLNQKEDWVRELNARKVYLGRRMYFPVEVVASLLNGEQAAQEKGE